MKIQKNIKYSTEEIKKYFPSGLKENFAISPEAVRNCPSVFRGKYKKTRRLF